MEMTNVKVGYTHAGVFHADDVFGAALLRIVKPDVEIRRVRVLPEGVDDTTPDVIIFDIGGGRFDHHTELKIRGGNQILPYSSFGLLWDEFGPTLLDEQGKKAIEEAFVIPVDEQDNGGDKNPLSIAISLFNPSWDEQSDPAASDEAFFKAVEMARSILARAIETERSKAKAKGLVEKAEVEATGKGFIVLDQFCPWQGHISDAVKLAVFPSLRGGWNIQSRDSKEFPLPEEWTKELPAGMNFAHPGRFMASCDTRENAISFAEIAVKPYI